MAWLGRLDAHVKTWPIVPFTLYHITKWVLVALGAFALGGVWLDRLGIWSLY